MATVDDYRVAPGTSVALAEHDPVDQRLFPDLDREGGREELDRTNRQLTGLQERLAAEGRHRLLVVLQAMDTGGKDGTIRNVFGAVNPQGLQVTSFKVPTEPERARDYLWRIHAQVPPDGGIAVFNRSHYEDVLVVRVRGLAPEERWRRRFEHINDLERMLADEGTTILKFFLHISCGEQKKRLEARLADPEKRWKFRTGDLEERARWGDYMEAYEEAIARTSTDWAPWWIVPADRKWYRDLVVSSAVVQALEGLDPRWPEPEDLAGVVVD